MRKYDFDFLIDGRPILIPDADVQISMEDMESDESGRDECGVMHRILLREKVKSWGLSYGSLTREEYLYMLSLFEGKVTFLLEARGADGQVTAHRAYCSNLGITVRNRRTGIYKNFNLNIMEC